MNKIRLCCKTSESRDCGGGGGQIKMFVGPLPFAVVTTNRQRHRRPEFHLSLISCIGRIECAQGKCFQSPNHLLASKGGRTQKN